MYERNTAVRLTNTIFATQSLFSGAQIAIFTLLSIMAERLSGQAALAGLPSSVLTLSHALVALPVGMLMGRFGRRFGLGVSYSTSAFGALIGVLAVLQGQFWLLLLSSALIGAGRAGAQQSRFAAGDMFPQSERGRMIGRIVFAGTIGAVGGPLLVAPGTQIAEFLGLVGDTGPWLIGSVMLAIAAFVTLVFLRPEPLEIARHIEDEQQRKKKKRGDVLFGDAGGRSIWRLLGLPRVQLAIMAMLISQTVMVALMVMTPLYMSQHGHGEGAIGLVISAHTLGMFGLSSVTGHLIDRYGRVVMMLAGAAVLIASAVISPLSTSVPVLVVGLFLLGLGWNFGYVAGSSLLADALEGEERARMQGAGDMLVSFAAALGSFSSGPVFSEGGYGAVAGVGIVLTLLLLWVVRLRGSSDVPQISE
jgi:MFS family permease